MTSQSVFSISASTAVHVSGLLAAFAFSMSLPEPAHYHTRSQRGSIELRGAFAETEPQPPQFVSLSAASVDAPRLPTQTTLAALAPAATRLKRQAESIQLTPAKLPEGLEDCACDASQHELKTPKRQLERKPEFVAVLEPPPARRKEFTETQPTFETSVELPSPPSIAGSDFDTPPRSVRSNPQPLYPEAARQRMQTGRVLLDVLISADGTVLDVKLIESSGVESLDRSALETVAKWKFETARKNGQPVESRVNIPVNFRKSW